MAEDHKPLTMWADVHRLRAQSDSPVSSTRDDPVQLSPDRLSTAELRQIRHREMLTISNRLGRLTNKRWDRWFSGAAILLLGGAIGGAFGLIPFFSSSPFPSEQSQVIYLGALGASFVLAVICGIASAAIKTEREDSVAAIKQDFDDILGAYDGAISSIKDREADH